MQHRRLKQKHWPNMKCIRSTIRKEENSTACHNITTNSEQEHFSGFTTEQVSLRSQQQNFSSNLLGAEDEEEKENATSTKSHCSVSQNSPFLFHYFLVLVLLTCAQFAGKNIYFFFY